MTHETFCSLCGVIHEMSCGVCGEPMSSDVTQWAEHLRNSPMCRLTPKRNED